MYSVHCMYTYSDASFFLKPFVDKIRNLENSLINRFNYINTYINNYKVFSLEQGRKYPLDTPKRMIERREREGKREKEMQKDRYREGGKDKRE